MGSLPLLPVLLFTSLGSGHRPSIRPLPQQAKRSRGRWSVAGGRKRQRYVLAEIVTGYNIVIRRSYGVKAGSV